MSEQELEENKLTKEEKKAEKLAKKRAKRAKKGTVFFPANKKGKHVCKLLNVLRVLCFPIHWLVYPFKRFGPYKVKDGACIFVGNHYCIWDIFYPAHATWEAVHFLAKQSVLDAPVLGFFAHKVGVIGAMRDGSDVRTLMDSLKALKNGEKVSLFPEGTRNMVSDEEFLPFFGGASMMAIKSKSPIIPFVICNRPRVFRMTHVRFGEPMELTEYYDRKLTAKDYEEADNLIRERLYALREEHRTYLVEKKAKRKDK